MIEIQYNTKSDFGHAMSSGSRRFRSRDELFDWLQKVLKETGWPIIISEIREV